LIHLGFLYEQLLKGLIEPQPLIDHYLVRSFPFPSGLTPSVTEIFCSSCKTRELSLSREHQDIEISYGNNLILAFWLTRGFYSLLDNMIEQVGVNESATTCNDIIIHSSFL